MKRICFLPLLFLHIIAAFTQTTEIDSLLQLARNNRNNFEAAMENVLAAKARTLVAFGDQSARYASCLYLQGCILSNQGKYEESEQAFLEAIHIQENKLGKEHPDCVQSIIDLGDLYILQGDFAKAETRLLEAQSISERTGRTEEDGFARLVASIGNYYRLTGDLEKAVEYNLRCMKVREQIFGKKHEKYAVALHNTALVYQQMGEYNTAENLFREAQTLFSETIGAHTGNYSNCINNLASLYWETGKYEQSEKLLLEARAIRASIFGTDHPEYANSLEALGALNMDMGNYEKARDLYLECKGIREATIGREHLFYANILNNLGSYFRAVREYDQSEKYYLEALSVYEKTVGGKHYNALLAKDNLAWAYREQGNYIAAEPLILEVLAAREQYLGSEHPDVASSLVNLAYLKMRLEKYEEAEKLQLRAKEIWGKTFGPQSLDYFANLRELASTQANLGRLEDALQTIAESSRLQKTIYFQAARHMTEEELAGYLDRFTYYFPQHFSYLQRLLPAPGTFTAQAFDDAIFQKGYLLDQASRVKKFTIQDPGFAAQYERLGALQTALATEYAKPPDKRSGVAEMEEEINTIEKTLVTAVAGYAERFRKVGWQDIQQSLQPGEVAVEFVHFDSLPEAWKPETIRYAALVLPAGDEYPAFVPLCAERDVPGYTPSQGGYPFDKTRPDQSFYRLFWKPLEAALGNAKTVYFSASGLLHRLNLEAIQMEDGQVLADRFQLVKLGSTRQLAFSQKTVPIPGGAALFGGIEYEPDKLSTQPPGTPQKMASRDAGTTDTTTLRLRGEKWTYLAWTKAEIETIGLLTEEAGIPTRIWTGREAREEVLKQLGGKQPSPRILHLATHGYFFPSPEEGGSDGSGFQASEHPMIRSGLILAGGNYAWENGQAIRPGADDGILTAYEIAQLDLSDTELVVLSACETGLGDIRGNEGVYGLQRAFKFAGARYVLMSLWKVPDFQTQELMTAFYFHWLEEKMEIPAAFQAAQAELRKQFPDPFLWAGFVLMR